MATFALLALAGLALEVQASLPAAQPLAHELLAGATARRVPRFLELRSADVDQDHVQDVKDHGGSDHHDVPAAAESGSHASDDEPIAQDGAHSSGDHEGESAGVDSVGAHDDCGHDGCAHDREAHDSETHDSTGAHDAGGDGHGHSDGHSDGHGDEAHDAGHTDGHDDGHGDESHDEGHSDGDGHNHGDETHNGSHGGGHSEGHSEGHGGHHAPSDVEMVVSVDVFAFIFICMSMMYALNTDDDDLRITAFKILGATMSIFSAVIFDTATYGFLMAWAKWFVEPFGEWEDESIAGDLQLIFNISIGLAWWVMLLILLSTLTARCRHRRIDLLTVSNVFPHIAAFAGIQLWGNLQYEVQQFAITRSRHPRLLPIAYIFAIGISLLISVLITSCARNRCILLERLHVMMRCLEDGAENEEEAEAAERKEWTLEVHECEHDACGLCYSFLVTDWILFSLTGIPRRPSMGMSYTDMPSDTPRKMSFFTIIFLFVFVASMTIRRKLRKSLKARGRKLSTLSWVWRLVVFTTVFWSHLHSWLLFRTVSTLVTAMFPELDVKEIVTACILSVIGGFVIVFLQMLINRRRRSDYQCRFLHIKTLKVVIDSFGLTIALSWHEAFDEADENVMHSQFPEKEGATIYLCISLLVLLFVLPGWRWYILPQCFEEPVEKDVAFLEGRDLEFVDMDSSASSAPQGPSPWSTSDDLATDIQKMTDSSGYTEPRPDVRVGTKRVSKSVAKSNQEIELADRVSHPGDFGSQTFSSLDASMPTLQAPDRRQVKLEQYHIHNIPTYQRRKSVRHQDLYEARSFAGSQHDEHRASNARSFARGRENEQRVSNARSFARKRTGSGGRRGSIAPQYRMVGFRKLDSDSD